jgi:drug/metabolite transporter (DMT)-like permease
VLLVLSKESSANATNYLLGDLLIFINAVSYAIYFILVKPLMQKYSPLHVVRWIFTIGFFMLLPFGWTELGEIQWEAFDLKHIIFLIAIVFTGTFLAYFFTAFGIQHLGAGTTGSYIYTQPLFAVIIAMVFLSEALTGQKIVAGALIFLGVYLVNFKSKQSVQ